MATLKEHQAAMVDLLANGSGIPASASRLAHAMHDVLEIVANSDLMQFVQKEHLRVLELNDATTPGINDKALSKREKALKTDSPAKWPTPAEQRVKELENTIRQLKANNAKLKTNLDCVENEVMCLRVIAEVDPKEAIGYILRANSAMTDSLRNEYLKSALEALNYEPEQAGCHKPDTQVCSHAWVNMPGLFIMPGSVHNREPYEFCTKCGAKQ